MLNNKGFAVSAILYTLLIAFLMFLAAALAMISSSTSLISKANDDIVNGTEFKAIQVKDSNGTCVAVGTNGGFYWYQKSDGSDSNTIVRITSRYGTYYWPKDFEGAIYSNSSETNSSDNKLNATYTFVALNETNILKITDNITESTITVNVGDICR